MSWSVGIDVGGTFTDFYVWNESSGEVRVFKLSSTPADPASAILEGLASLWPDASEDDRTSVRFVGHGTTVGTNALLERKGARTIMVVTKGFRDVLEIGRQARPHLYDLQVDKVPPLVDRYDVLEADERLYADGRVAKPLSEGELDRLVEAVTALDPEAVAVCLLNAFASDVHEQRIADALRARQPALAVSTSAALVGELREVERFSTTVANAFIMPAMRAYFDRLAAGLDALEPGASDRFYVMQSDGGLGSLAAASEAPVRLTLSGPAAGAVAAGRTSMQAGEEQVITLDMGGTSTDVALITHGEPALVHQTDVAGLPLKLPTLDIHTVGAGGGSIAYASDGLLKVGPLSAGAAPGPASYGEGGERPTVTDAHVALGRIANGARFGQRIRVDRSLAIAALDKLGRELGMDPITTALGILKVANANIGRAVSRISVERGVDPRDYALLPFGGAGPLHAAEVAEAMAVSKVLVPRYPGALSALGLLAGDRTRHFARSSILPLGTEQVSIIAAIHGALVRQARAWFSDEGVEEDARELRFSIDLRHEGQNHELNVQAMDPAAPDFLARLKEAFFQLHQRLYGYALHDDPVVAITYRLEAVGRRTTPLAAAATVDDVPAPRPSGRRRVIGDQGEMEAAVFQRHTLLPGQALVGPCVVEQSDATTWVPNGFAAKVDAWGNLLLHR